VATQFSPQTGSRNEVVVHGIELADGTWHRRRFSTVGTLRPGRQVGDVGGLEEHQAALLLTDGNAPSVRGEQKLVRPCQRKLPAVLQGQHQRTERAAFLEGSGFGGIARGPRGCANFAPYFD